MKIEFPSHFPHGLYRVQDIAISDLAPNALPTATRLSCRSCRQPGTADLQTQRPNGQGRYAMANAATEGIPHDNVSRSGARDGGNC